MELDKIYNKYYSRSIDIEDGITKLLINYVKKEENLEVLKQINDLGMQPAQAFIYINYSEIKPYIELFKDNEYKKYYGTLFGAIFYELGYSKENSEEIPIKNFIFNAKLFRK